jgi:phosphatidylserine decarboxylase
MSIRREVWPWCLGSGFIAVACYVGWLWTDWLSLQIVFAIFAFLTVFFIYFFRDPDREPDSEAADVWLSPADGVVTRIEEEEDGRTRIVIFLTVFNVHVNRMPVDGKIEEQDYRPGRFLPAFAGELEQKNEQNRLLCRDQQGREFEVWQIAGMLARRIYCWKDVSDSFSRGDRFGMIALSSRTDLILPEDVTPTVDPKDTVRGGQTVVAQG